MDTSWATHQGELHGDKILTDFLRMYYIESGQTVRVDRSDMYAMRVSPIQAKEKQ